MNTSGLNMQFYQYYLAGSAVEVELPDGTRKSGTIGVSQGDHPVFWLLSGSRKTPACELCHRCRMVRMAVKKTRIDSPGYLSGVKPTFILRRRGSVPSADAGTTSAYNTGNTFGEGR